MTDLGVPAAWTVRPVRPEDLQAVARVFAACWTGTYAAFLPAGLVGRYADPPAAEELWRTPFDRARRDPGQRRLAVAERPGDRTVFGVVATHVDTGYLASLYVHPDAQGLGIGGVLLADAVEVCRRAGHARLTLWVFSDNAAATGFYRRHGAQPTGRHRVEAEYGLDETELSIVL